MKLAGTDYMRERHRGTGELAQRWGARESSPWRTLWAVLFFLMIVFLGYRLAEWRESHRAASTTDAATALGSAAAPGPSSGPPQARAPTDHQILTGNSEPDRATAPRAPERAATTTVIKCVINGRTTYAESESDCVARAEPTVLTIDGKQNVSDGLPNAPQIIRRSSTTAQLDTGSTGPDSNVQRQALCQAYEDEIKSIDARARQPLSGQEQDWLAARRKKARDEQFRLRC